MVSDQEIVNGVESLLRQSNPNAVTSINGLVQQLEAKLGLDLSHKAGFIRDLLGGGGGGGGGSGGGGGAFGGGGGVRSPPPNPQPSPPSVQPKDLFTLQHFPQFHSSTAQHFPSHFALPHHHHHQQQQQHNHHNHHHHHHLEEFNFRYPQQQQQPQQQLYPYPHQHLHPQQRQHPIPHPNPNAHPQHQHQQQRIDGSFVSTISEAGSTEIKKGSAPAGTKRRGGPGGLNKVCGVSPELEAVVGEPALPRTQIVKQLWAYIRKHNLQDPSNKRKIICDDALRLLFETDCTDMFKMNKLLSKHIRPLQPTKEPGPDSKRLKTETESTIESTEASAEVSAEASTEASPEAASDTGSATVIISDALANFFETEEREMPQSEAVRRVWEHIKINQLEDQQNPMMIVCDSKLQELFGCENISALEIAEMLMTNFVKQL